MFGESLLLRSVELRAQRARQPMPGRPWGGGCCLHTSSQIRREEQQGFLAVAGSRIGRAKDDTGPADDAIFEIVCFVRLAVRHRVEGRVVQRREAPRQPRQRRHIARPRRVDCLDQEACLIVGRRVVHTHRGLSGDGVRHKIKSTECLPPNSRRVAAGPVREDAGG